MSESLIVRLSSQDEAPIDWLAWSESSRKAVDVGQLSGRQELAELVPLAESRTVILLLAAKDVILSEVEIPVGAGRQLDGLLPYLLEDDVAQDVEDLQFLLLAKQGSRASVCGVDRQWLSGVLDELTELHIEVRKIVPDVLALPSSSGLSAAQIDQAWLVKKGAYLGLQVDKEWLELVKDSDWVREGEEFLELQAHSPLPNIVYAEDQHWQQAEARDTLELLAEHASASSVNLLTGVFKPKSAWSKYVKVWQGAAIALLLFVAVQIGHSLLQVHQYQTQASAYRAESERIFHRLFPNRHRIPTISYLKRLMEDEVHQLSGDSADSSVLTWLTKLPTTLGSVKGMQLQSVRYDASRGELRVAAFSQDFQSFEKARVALQKDFDVKEGQLGRDGKVVSGTFVLKKK